MDRLPWVVGLPWAGGLSLEDGLPYRMDYLIGWITLSDGLPWADKLQFQNGLLLANRLEGRPLVDGLPLVFLLRI